MKPKQTKTTSNDRLNKTIEELRSTNRELRAKLKDILNERDEAIKQKDIFERRTHLGEVSEKVFQATFQDRMNELSSRDAKSALLNAMCVEESGKLELEQRRRHAAVVLGVRQPYNISIDPQI